MENGMKQLFIKNFKEDLEMKITELKKEQKAFMTLGGLKKIMKDSAEKDEVVMILYKLQTFAEKQIAEEIEMYEEALQELQKISGTQKDMETIGMVA